MQLGKQRPSSPDQPEPQVSDKTPVVGDASAAEVFRERWPTADEVDFVIPDDPPAEPVASWDD